jgi:uridine kinase
MLLKTKCMKIAILISGYLRSFEHNLENIKNKIIDKFDSADVYLHITENEISEDRYLNVNHQKTIEKIKKILNPISTIVESNVIFSKNNKKNVIYNQWSKYYKLNKLKKIHEEFYGEYDLVIKLRPDLHFVSEIDFKEKNNSVFVPKDSKIDKNKLLNPNDNFITDTFAFGDSESMDLYFDIFKNLDDLTKEYGFTPETILFEYLKNKIGIIEIDLNYYIILSNCNVFAICGDSGSGKTTLGNLLKQYFNSSFLLECDRYHKWERNDENWKNVTHLNPDANFITKMNEDIFDLKIGKSIYQVDYDHSTGKFTQKQKIKNPENLIVCGLHSLYGNEQNLYDLKIFMDTEEKLKKKWKIKRDVEKRNYTEEKILKQINDRKYDFEKYILPQKENSNVIVNFYENEYDLLNLKIKINKELLQQTTINKITSNFPNANIFYDTDFISFTFSSFQENEVFNQLKYRTFDFYDYIIYILLNLKNNE